MASSGRDAYPMSVVSFSVVTEGQEAEREGAMEEHGEVCIQEEVGRLWEQGLSEDEIAGRMGLDVSYVSSVVGMLAPDMVGED